MNKVYVVTSGVYSDYGIDCVFDNLEDAERYIFMCKKDDEYYSGNFENKTTWQLSKVYLFYCLPYA